MFYRATFGTRFSNEKNVGKHKGNHEWISQLRAQRGQHFLHCDAMRKFGKDNRKISFEELWEKEKKNKERVTTNNLLWVFVTFAFMTSSLLTMDSRKRRVSTITLSK